MKQAAKIMLEVIKENKENIDKHAYRQPLTALQDLILIIACRAFERLDEIETKIDRMVEHDK